jgi:hypothetical protein
MNAAWISFEEQRSCRKRCHHLVYYTFYDPSHRGRKKHPSLGLGNLGKRKRHNSAHGVVGCRFLYEGISRVL